MPLQLLKIGGLTIIALINILLGSLVFARNPKNRINIVFFFLSLAFAVWVFSLLFYEFPIIFPSLFWIKSTYLFTSIFMALTLIFSFIFPQPITPKVFKIALISILLYFIFVVRLLFLTDLWISGVTMDPETGLHTILGPAYIWWVLVSWGLVIWALFNFFSNSRKSTGKYKAQLRYLFIGFALWGISVNIPDVILPLFWNNTRYFSISTISSLFFSLSIAYVILKHRFFDIRLVIARSISYALLLLLLGLFYAAGLFFIGRFILGDQTTTASLVPSTILAVIMAFSFQPIRRFLEKITDNIFYKDQYNPEELIYELSRKMSENIQLNVLVEEILQILKDRIKITTASLLIVTKGGLQTTTKDHHATHPTPTEKDLCLLSERGAILIFEEEEEGRVKSVLRKYDISVFIPLIVEEKQVGYLLLSQKSSGDIYFDQDIKTLETLAPQFAVALQNAQSYEEIKHFSETLKEKVDKATNDLQIANKRLRQLSNLKDEFFSVAAHELRTPLTAIMGNASLIQQHFGDKFKDNKDIPEMIADIQESSERLIKIVNDYLDASRLEKGRIVFKIENFNIVDIVKETIEDLIELATEKGLSLKIDEPATPRMVSTDKDRAKQVIYNLVGNAIKYTNEGSITIHLEPQGKSIFIRVEDTGIGISQQEQALLFQKFQQVGENHLDRKASRGTGMGLYISKLLAEGMNGKVYLEKSEPEKGSVFAFELPAARVAKKSQ